MLRSRIDLVTIDATDSDRTNNSGKARATVSTDNAITETLRINIQSWDYNLNLTARRACRLRYEIPTKTKCDDPMKGKRKEIDSIPIPTYHLHPTPY